VWDIYYDERMCGVFAGGRPKDVLERNAMKKTKKDGQKERG
jgi:hypothetical protein